MKPPLPPLNAPDPVNADRYQRIVAAVADYICTIEFEAGQPTSSIHCQSCQSLTGYTEAELQAEPGLALEMVAAEDRKRVETHRSQLATATNPAAIEYAIVRKDGERRWVRERPVPHRTEDGTLVAVDCLIRDITGQRTAQLELEASELRFRMLAGMMPVTVAELDLGGNITYVNDYGFESTGFTQADLEAGLNALDMIAPTERLRAARNMERLLKGEDIGPNEYQALRKDGSSYAAIIRSLPILKNGHPVGLRSVIFDIHELQEAREALAASEQRYRMLVENANSIILRWNEAGEITYFNEFAEKVFGYTKEEILGRPVVGTIVPPTESTGRNLKPLMDDICHHPEKYKLNINENMRSDGQRIWVAWTNKAVFEEAAGRPEVLSIGSDITERMQLERRLQQSEKMQAIGCLAGGIAHDFNNQLAVMQGNTELILNVDQSAEEMREHVEEIHTAIKRSARLIRQLLAYARKGDFQSQTVSVHELVEETISFLKHSLDKKIGLERELAATPANTLGDPNQLQNAFLNLAINARDAMPDGGTLRFATANVHIDATAAAAMPFDVHAGDYIQLRISDTGVGMDEETQAHVFEPFFTTKASGKGTGMGLASVYGTVKNHKGFITFKSAPGQGTTFEVSLPQTQQAAAHAKTPRPIRAARQDARVMVVDDEPLLVRVGTTLLGKLGYQTAGFTDPAAALAHYREAWHEIDLALIDMIMPKLNGRELFNELRAINPAVRVLVISGFALSAESQALLQEGAQGFITKPFEIEKLAAAVANALPPAASD